MSDIIKFDKNLVVKQELLDDDTEIFHASEAPFRIYGLQHNGKYFYRLPEEVAKASNEGVEYLNLHTAGGRIRFITDSPTVFLHADMHRVDKMSHFPLTGSAGFDMYTGEGENSIYQGTFIPDFDIKNGLDGRLWYPAKGQQLITIHFPTYAGVKNVFIGLKKGSILLPPTPYAHQKPVVFYGSSITQGGCCSRPGNTYQSILSRRLGFDYINLGFSGSARAEPAMASYLSGLDMSVFVLDYDHNAPSAEHLQNTHEALFKAVREKNPTLPILMLTRPKFHLDEDEQKRLAIVEATYRNALHNGDKNVYFIKGCDLIQRDCTEVATVDNCHPNDAGFLSMANAIEPILKKCLGIEN